MYVENVSHNNVAILRKIIKVDAEKLNTSLEGKIVNILSKTI